jgi:hypothetical protein
MIANGGTGGTVVVNDDDCGFEAYPRVCNERTKEIASEQYPPPLKNGAIHSTPGSVDTSTLLDVDAESVLPGVVVVVVVGSAVGCPTVEVSLCGTATAASAASGECNESKCSVLVRAGAERVGIGGWYNNTATNRTVTASPAHNHRTTIRLTKPKTASPPTINKTNSRRLRSENNETNKSNQTCERTVIVEVNSFIFCLRIEKTIELNNKTLF